MLKNSLKIALCAILSFVLIGCAKQEVKNEDSKGKNIVCFGDSITFGYGVSSGEDYPSALAKLVKIPVINKGIDGDTSTEALKRLDSDVLDREPLLVLIEFCGNDFLRKVPKEITLKNIGEMVDRIQAHGAMVAVIDVSAGMFLSEYRSAFHRLAKEKKALFIASILNGIITNPSLKSDFLHPNQRGYKIIAQNIYLAIKPYIEDRPAVSPSK
ncbi:MAG: GDSL-type esterase/lipase family protein [Candidatus Omnitrophica bacterium]|nr:GDSL-type esterase/lipase family protein [Candidatus Omnitrophota bacterium]